MEICKTVNSQLNISEYMSKIQYVDVFTHALHPNKVSRFVVYKQHSNYKKFPFKNNHHALKKVLKLIAIFLSLLI